MGHKENWSMGALEIPDAVHAAGTFAGAASVSPFPTSRMITSAGFTGCVRNAAGKYTLTFEQPINLGECDIHVGFPLGFPGFSANAQVAADGLSMRVELFNAAGVQADASFFYVSILKIPGNTIYAEALPTTPTAQPAIVPGFINGLTLSVVSATTLDVSAGQANDSTDTDVLSVATAQTLVDSAVVGLNGIDTGVLAAASSYFMYIIGGDGVPTGFIFSLSAVSPALPTGYTLFRRIGSFHTIAGGASILTFKQEGKQSTRRAVHASLLVPADRLGPCQGRRSLGHPRARAQSRELRAEHGHERACRAARARHQRNGRGRRDSAGPQHRVRQRDHADHHRQHRGSGHAASRVRRAGRRPHRGAGHRSVHQGQRHGHGADAHGQRLHRVRLKEFESGRGFRFPKFPQR
jgi:hypothetical protein